MFSTLSKKEIIIQAALNLSSANAFHLVKAKILSFGKALKEIQESMDRCTGHSDITEILLKTALNTIQHYLVCTPSCKIHAPLVQFKFNISRSVSQVPANHTTL